METVNFACSGCGKLMAVNHENLGLYVRCPHCRLEVQAPAGASVPINIATGPSAPSPFSAGTVPPASDNTEIFVPTADVKPAQVVSPVSQEEPIPASFTPDHTAILIAPESSDPEETSASPDAPAVIESAPSSAEGHGIGESGSTSWQLVPQAVPPTGAESASVPADSVIANTVEVRDEGMLKTLVLIFLIPYAILATIAAVYFYHKAQQVFDPLERLPDYPGDNTGATRKGRTSSTFERIKPESPLSAKLHVPLGGRLRIGDLEVVPERVEQRKIVYCSEQVGRRPETSTEPALVLTLKLLNVSVDDYFVPTDPAFDTLWRENDPPAARPYTFLQVGERNFYGGPFRWAPRVKKSLGWREPDPREFIQGQEHNNEVLKPGEERATVICTDPADPAVLKAVGDFHGPLLWRVRLRCGLVGVRERDVAVSAVIGVEFSAHEIAGR